MRNKRKILPYKKECLLIITTIKQRIQYKLHCYYYYIDVIQIHSTHYSVLLSIYGLCISCSMVSIVRMCCIILYCIVLYIWVIYGVLVVWFLLCYILDNSAKSKALTEARFAAMRHRDEKINLLKQQVLTKLAAVSSSNQYPTLLRYLIAQGLMTLLENEVTLQVRKEDLPLIKKELPAAIQLYQDTMKTSTNGIIPTVKVIIDEKNFLPSGPSSSNNTGGASCTGGILLSARDGQIVCRNTLDHRLELAFDSLKPTLRGSLFGVREKIQRSIQKKQHGGVSLPK